MPIRITSADADLSVADTGRGSPLLLLHGWAMDSRVFQRQVPALARHFRVICPDRRGYGQSTGRASLALELDDLDRIFATLRIDSAHIAGISQGGRIALRYAVTRPQRIRSLVLQGAPLDGYQAPADPAGQIPLGMFTALARAGDLDSLRARWLAHPMMAEPAPDPQARALLETMLADYQGADLLAGTNPEAAPDVDGLLAATRLPALLTSGARETVERRAVAKRILQLLPRAREIVFEHSGHLGNLSEAQRWNDAVIDFCRAVDSGRI